VNTRPRVLRAAAVVPAALLLLLTGGCSHYHIGIPLVPGLSLGLGANIPDDQELLKAALPVYDALYTWCQSLAGERHGWNPDAILEPRQP